MCIAPYLLWMRCQSNHVVICLAHGSGIGGGKHVTFFFLFDYLLYRGNLIPKNHFFIPRYCGLLLHVLLYVHAAVNVLYCCRYSSQVHSFKCTEMETTHKADVHDYLEVFPKQNQECCILKCSKRYTVAASYTSYILSYTHIGIQRCMIPAVAKRYATWYSSAARHRSVRLFFHRTIVPPQKSIRRNRLVVLYMYKKRVTAVRVCRM